MQSSAVRENMACWRTASSSEWLRWSVEEVPRREMGLPRAVLMSSESIGKAGGKALMGCHQDVDLTNKIFRNMAKWQDPGSIC